MSQKFSVITLQYHINEISDFGDGKYKCSKCGYVYDPEKGDSKGGIDPGTKFEDLPEDWKCPRCRKGKDMFKQV